MGCGASANYKLTQTEQLRLETNNGIEIIRGPKEVYLSRWSPPLKEEVEQMVKLDADEYAVIRDTTKALLRTEAGEKRFFLEAQEELVSKGHAISLSQTEYCYAQPLGDGKPRLVKGPTLYVPGAYEKPSPKYQALTLDNDMYVRMQDKVTGDVWVECGPKLVFPEPTEEVVGGGPQRAVVLDSKMYLKLQDKITGEVHTEYGPKLVFPAATKEVIGGGPQTAVTLDSNMYVKLQDKVTGQVQVECGPKLVFPGPTQVVIGGGPQRAEEVDAETSILVRDLLKGSVRLVQDLGLFFPNAHEEIVKVQRSAQMLKLEADDYAVIRDTEKNQLRIEEGEQRFFLQLNEELVSKAQAVRLSETEYLYVDNGAGKQRLVKGPMRFVPGPYETIIGKKNKAITLSDNMYVKVQDKVTGEVRVERGPQLICPEPSEEIQGGGAHKGVQVDSETAVLIRDSILGTLRLKKDHGLFIPRAQDEIVSVQKLIRLEDHQCVVMKDEHGSFKYFYGNDELRGDQPRAFFLPPYCQQFEHCWSRGRTRQTRDLRFSHLDMRPKFMNFEFNSRTSDNVELVLEGTFYWQIQDVPKMMKFSGDVTGDISNYARSAFIQKISKVTLKQFMDDFRKIANEVIAEDTGFYESRGLKVHSLEVTGYRCAESSTAAILQQMIQETTNRMNRTSQQESENELSMNKIQGEIEQERMKGELLTIKQSYMLEEARADGSADAERAAQFLRALEGVVPEGKERVAMWKVLRKNDALGNLAAGNAHLYFTPSDVNLSIEDRGGK